MSILRRYV